MLPIPEHQRGPEKLKQLRFYRPEGKMQVLRDGPIPLFPPEIIYEIARHVEGDDFDTMQNLNRVCKVVHAITLPLLYDTLIWDKTEEHPWRVVSEPSSGRRYTRFLILHQELYDDLRDYAALRLADHGSDEGDDNDTMKALFPSLVSILLFAPPLPNAESEPVSTACQLHLYGVVAPFALVHACRPWRLRSSWTKSNDDRFGSSHDTDATERTDEDLEEPDRVTPITNLVLHRHARLRFEGSHDVDYPSQSVHFMSASSFGRGPQLDIRLLHHQDDMQDTLNGCVWLFNKGVTNCDPEPDTETSMSRAVNVFCHEEMVRPMAQTFATQRPLPLRFTLCENTVDNPRPEPLLALAAVMHSDPVSTRLVAFCPDDEIYVIIGPVIEANEGLPDWRAGFLMGTRVEPETGMPVYTFLDLKTRIEGDGVPASRYARLILQHMRLATSTTSAA